MCRLLAITSSVPIDATPILAEFAARCRASKEYQGHGWGVARADGDGRGVARTDRDGRDVARTDGDEGGVPHRLHGDVAWRRYRSVRPIWEDEWPRFEPARMWIVHARSAFRNEGVVVANNMPFLADDLAFAFNGELRGVRLQAPGDTGAARLLHLLGRFRTAADGNVLDALVRLDRVVSQRSHYVRALNVVAADRDRVYVHCHYSEDAEYFTLHTAVGEGAPGARIEAGEGGRDPTDAGGRADTDATPAPPNAPIAIVCSERLDVPGIGPWEPVPNHSTLALETGVTC
jgi:glutamine amidotransferase